MAFSPESILKCWEMAMAAKEEDPLRLPVATKSQAQALRMQLNRHRKRESDLQTGMWGSNGHPMYNISISIEIGGAGWFVVMTRHRPLFSEAPDMADPRNIKLMKILNEFNTKGKDMVNSPGETPIPSTADESK